MIRSKPRVTLLAAALGLLLGGGALPVLAEAPLGLRDSQQVDYGATAPVNPALTAYLSQAAPAATLGAFDTLATGRYGSPAASALSNLAQPTGAPVGAYDTGRVASAFAVPAVGDAVRAAMRDQAAGAARVSGDASLDLAPVGRGLRTDRASDTFGRLSFGQPLDGVTPATAFAAQTAGDRALRQALRAEPAASGLFAAQRGTFSSPVSGDQLAGAFTGRAEATGAFAAATETGWRAALRSEGFSGGHFDGDDGSLSAPADLDDLVAGLASDSLDLGGASAGAALSAPAADPVRAAMRADRAGGGFLAAEAGLSSPLAVDFERIGAILAGEDGE